MTYNILTIFPRAFDSFLQTSLIARGISKKIIDVKVYDLRDFATDKHKSVDDRPYGGGPGMVMRVDIINRAIENLKLKNEKRNNRIILLEPAGKPFTQKAAKRLAKYNELIFIVGHYEGIDERVRGLADEEISIGDYVLTGGELPAMVMMDAVSRMIPGFLGKENSIHEESFEDHLLEYPQYTRPKMHNNKKVPKVLLSGDHAKIKKWRAEQSFKRTQKRRPDLFGN